MVYLNNPEYSGVTEAGAAIGLVRVFLSLAAYILMFLIYISFLTIPYEKSEVLKDLAYRDYLILKSESVLCYINI
jgi:protein-S-isoprenylcysteine O-methyltransferase Ste14